LRPLGRAVHAKTEGNPFFIHQLIRSLQEGGVIRYESDQGLWRWDGKAATPIINEGDVVDFMSVRVEQLSAPQRHLLKSLASIGSRSRLDLLSTLMGEAPDKLKETARSLIETGFLTQAGADYSFAHDRILEVSRALTPEEERPHRHAQIARLMIASAEASQDDAEFKIAEQVELASAGAVAEPDRPSFAHALLDASKRARKAAAAEQAARYVEGAARLSSKEWWTTHPRLAYEIVFERTRILMQRGDIDVANIEVDALIARAERDIDRAMGYRLKATLRTLQSDYDGAIAAGLAGLSLLGVSLHRYPSKAECDSAFERIQKLLGDRPILSLADLPLANDAKVEEIMSLLSTLIAAIFSDDGLRFVHLAKIVELTLLHGVAAGSAYGLAWFGVFIADVYGQYQDGFAYGQAALELVDRHGFETQRTGTLVAFDQISPWTRPFSFAVARIREAIAAGHAANDLGMTCYARNHLVSDLIQMGGPIAAIEEEIEYGLELTKKINFRDIELLISGQKGLIGRLARDEILPAFEAAGDIASESTQFWVRLYDGIGAYFFGDYARARAVFSDARGLVWAVPAHIDLVYFAFFSALNDARGLPPEEALPAMAVQRQKFFEWSKINPDTFDHKLLLVDAEMARLRGDDMGALRLFDRSISAAHGFVHERALAYELAAIHCATIGMDSMAAQYGRAARAAYRQWGALAKAAALEAAFPAWFVADAEEQARLSDLDQLLELSLRFSEELVFDRLVDTVMRALLDRSGGRRGLLLLLRDGEPLIEAIADRNDDIITVEMATAIPTDDRVDPGVLRTVLRTRQPVEIVFSENHWLLCLPLVKDGAFIGMIYLEDDSARGGLIATRREAVSRIAVHATISLETARRHTELMQEGVRRSQAENALRTARAELARTSSLTVMGGLAASIVHEVNQPLASIVSNAGASIRWLKHDTPNVSEAMAGLESIRAGGLRVGEIIRGLRALAMREPPSRQPIDLNGVVREVLQLTGSELEEHHVALDLRLNDVDCIVLGDRVQLQQVVFNLVTNAIDAMAAIPAPERVLTVTSTQAGGWIAVHVEDHGEGVAPEARARIFTPLFTTKSKGMGMGLAICRSIMEAHGGALDVRSAAVRGTIFEFTLPCQDGA
jgi:signal transduction histidine kinase